jgi:hypothetical protein
MRTFQVQKLPAPRRWKLRKWWRWWRLWSVRASRDHLRANRFLTH